MSITFKPTKTTVIVHQPCNVRLAFSVDEDLVPGDMIEVQMPNSWLVRDGQSFTREVQTEDSSASHFMHLSVPGHSVRFRMSISPRHLNYPEGTVRHGRLFSAVLEHGCVPAGVSMEWLYTNTYAPYIAEEESVWMRIKGCVPEALPCFKVEPGTEVAMRVIVPSGAEPGRTFDVLVVSLDEFDNASSTRHQKGKLVRSDGVVVADNLDFTGCLRMPVSIESKGVFRFNYEGVVSNAVRVCDCSCGPYWGDIHIHTKLSHDAQGPNPYDYARNVSGLDFAAACDHWPSLGPEGYKLTTEWAEGANLSGRFVTIPAYELNPRHWTGHHNVYFRNTALFNKFAFMTESERDNFPAPPVPDPADVMVIPHHSGIIFSSYNGDSLGSTVTIDAVDDRGLRPALEIYSHHGQSETYAPQHILSYEFNRMRTPSRRANVSVPGPYYAQDYWAMGRRIGVLASSDEHSGQGGRPHGGFAGVWAKDLTREAVFDAIRARHSYATTGERILVEFDVDGLCMGEEGSRSKGVNLPLRLRVWGTRLLLHVEILRFRFGADTRFEQIVSLAPRPESMDAVIEIEDTLNYPCVYYARVTQEPLAWPDMAWTSPVWVDIA